MSDRDGPDETSTSDCLYASLPLTKNRLHARTVLVLNCQQPKAVIYVRRHERTSIFIRII